MSTKVNDFEFGKVYCVGTIADNVQSKRIVRYRGPDQPWEDICSGEVAQIDTCAIYDVIEVPTTVVDAISLAKDKLPIPAAIPHNQYDEDREYWEGDVYWDD